MSPNIKLIVNQTLNFKLNQLLIREILKLQEEDILKLIIHNHKSINIIQNIRTKRISHISNKILI